MGAHGPLVVVHAHEVRRRFDGRLAEVRPRLAECLDDLGRVRPPKGRVEEEPVDVGVPALGGGPVGRRVGCPFVRLQVDDQPDGLGPAGSEGVRAEVVGAEQVVGHERRLEPVAVARRVRALDVAVVHDHPRLVQRDPPAHAVAEPLDDGGGVVREAGGCVGVEPPAAVVERRREVPVVERRERLDAVLQQLVNEAVVEGEARPVDAAGAAGQDAAPGDGEAVGVQPQVGHERDVGRHPAVVVAGDVAGVAVDGAPRGVREAVPDRGAGAVGERGALDLVGRRGGAPEKAGGEGGGAVGHQRVEGVG